MIPALSLDASDDTDSGLPEFCTREAVPVERILPDSLSDVTDSAVQGMERFCYAQFQTATTNADKADWIHNLAACIVEMHKRGLSIGAKA